MSNVYDRLTPKELNEIIALIVGNPEQEEPQPQPEPQITSRVTSEDIADQVKSSVSMTLAAAAYGVRLDRNGFGLCPFHTEKTGSFHVRRDGRSWFCFGCGAGGDVINFVRRLYDLSFPEAVEKLNDDFNLGIPLRRRLTPRQRAAAAHRAERENQQRRLYDEALQRANKRCDNAWRRWTLLDTIKRKCSPQYLREHHPDLSKDLYDTALDLWAAALHEIPLAEYECEQADSERYMLEHKL